MLKKKTNEKNNQKTNKAPLPRKRANVGKFEMSIRMNSGARFVECTFNKLYFKCLVATQDKVNKLITRKIFCYHIW